LQLLIADSDHPFWLPLIRASGWTPALLFTMASVAYDFMAGLCLRCIFPFAEWPWPIAAIALPETSAVERAALEEQIRELQPCCIPPSDGLTLFYQRRLASGASDAANLMFVRDVFGMCNNSNVLTEDRFPTLHRHIHR
jgi:hypothetical protein